MGVISDMVKIAAAPVGIVADVARVVTKPVADLAEEVAKEVKTATRDVIGEDKK